MAITGTGTELAAQVMAKAIELIEGCAASCNATIDGDTASIRKDGAERVAMMREDLRAARERGNRKLPFTEEEIQEVERETEEFAARSEREKDGVALMLMETRLMLRSLEFHVRQMKEKQGS